MEKYHHQLTHHIRPKLILAGNPWGILYHSMLMLLLILGPIVTKAQQFPVQATTVVTPPYSIFLSDYASAESNSIQLILNLLDLDRTQYQAKLRLTIEGAGITIRTTDSYIPPPIILQGGFPESLSGFDIRNYFNPDNLDFSGITKQEFIRSGALPEGFYTFTFEVLDFNRNVVVSNPAIANAWLVLNDPPLINLPFNGDKVRAQDPQNILFSWTPLHTASPNAAFNTEYEFRLVELYPKGRNPNDAILASNSIFTTTTTSTSLNYGIAEPQLIPGRKYAFRIRAFDISDRDLFKNNGFSEVFVFQFGDECLAPTEIKAKVLDPDRIKFGWEGQGIHTEYELRYRVEGKKEWYSENTFLNDKVIPDLKSNTTYEYQVRGKCGSVVGPYTALTKVTTPELIADDSQFICGSDIPQFEIETIPLELPIGPGDIIQSADFDILITSIEANGDGTFKGTGEVPVPYFELAKLEVRFDKIRINTKFRVYEGNIITVYNPNSNNIWPKESDDSDELDESEDDEDSSDGEESDEDNPDTDGDDPGTDEDDPDTEEDDPDSTDDEDDPDSTDGDDEEDSDDDTDTVGDDTTDELDGLDGPEGGNSDDDDSDDDNDDPGTGEGSNAKIWYAGDNKEYDNGSTIQVSYHKLVNNLAFTLKYYPEDTDSFRWSITHSGTDITETVKNNEPIYDNFGVDLKNRAGTLPLKVVYGNEEITVNLEITQKDFDIVNIFAKDKTKRIATSGEILYLVDGAITKVNRQIRYDVALSPNPPENSFGDLDIAWSYRDQTVNKNLQQEFGVKHINRNLKETDDILTTSVSAGSPDKETRSVDVKWVDGSIKSFSFVPPATSAVLTKIFNDVGGNLQLVTRKIPILGLDFELDPLKITGSEFNLEDDNSRLYKHFQQGSIKAGITLQTDRKLFTLPFLQVLSRAGIVDLGLYGQLSLNFSATGGMDRFKFVESSNYQGQGLYIDFAANGCIQVGLIAELLVAKELVNFEVKGSATGCLTGRLRYRNNTGDFEGSVFIPPIVLAGNIKISTKGVLEFDLVDWSKSVTITNKIPIYPNN